MSIRRKRKDPCQGDLFRSSAGKASGHGGARRGAGRPRKQGRRKGAHRRRQGFSSPRPLHVTVRLMRQLRSLRTRKKYKVLRDVFCKTRRKGFRLCHFSVQDDHIHLIVEAASRAAMTAGMRSVNTRIGHQMNAAFGRKRGQVIADRYHEKALNSPRQVRNTLAYVLNNGRRHVWKQTGETCQRGWLDPCSSSEFFDGWKGVEDPVPITTDAPIEAPRTWLLKKLWRRHHLIDINEIPGQQGLARTGNLCAVEVRRLAMSRAAAACRRRVLPPRSAAAACCLPPLRVACRRRILPPPHVACRRRVLPPPPRHRHLTQTRLPVELVLRLSIADRLATNDTFR